VQANEELHRVKDNHIKRMALIIAVKGGFVSVLLLMFCYVVLGQGIVKSNYTTNYVNLTVQQVEDFGASPSASEATNTAAFQGALDAAHIQGGGSVRITKPGTYTVKPTLGVWPNTTVTIGSGVMLIANANVYTGIKFNTTYSSPSITPRAGTVGASSTVFVSGTNVASFDVGAVLTVYGVDGNGVTHQTDASWIPGCYIVRSVNTGNNSLTVDRNCSVATATNLDGCLGFSMFRDALYDTCVSNAFGKSTIITYQSDNIRFEGPGTIDMNTASGGIPTGYFTTGLWMRQVQHLFIGRGLKIQNCKIYATALEDVRDSNVDELVFNTQRDGLHFFGPLTNVVIKNVSGICNDDIVAYVPGDSPTGYPIDTHPRVGFFGDAQNVTIQNITVYQSYNPVRLAGPSVRSARNIIIDGVHGSITGGGTAGGSAVTLINDTDLTGMAMSGIQIMNVDALLQQSTNDAYALVYAFCNGLKNLTIRDIFVRGQWTGVNVGPGSGGGWNTLQIRNVTVDPALANIGTNRVVTVTSDFNAQQIIVDGVSAAFTSLAGGTNLYFHSVGGNPIYQLNNINSYYGQLYFGNGAASSLTQIQINNANLWNYFPLIQMAGGSPTFFFNNLSINNANSRWFNAISGTGQNGAVTILGCINYGNVAGDNATIGGGPGGWTSLRVNSPFIHVYAGDDTPSERDQIWDITSGNGPSVYRVGVWGKL
jgi:hypothetical protein